MKDEGLVERLKERLAAFPDSSAVCLLMTKRGEMIELTTHTKDLRVEIERLQARVAELEAGARKVRDGYASQARFADHEPASYFREFVARLDALLNKETGSCPK